MLGLVYNECLKIWRKKLFFVILIILCVLIPIFTYAQLKMADQARKALGTSDWRMIAQSQMSEISGRLANPRIPEEWKKLSRVQFERLKYYVEKNVDPIQITSVTFTREFMKNNATVILFLPLMVMLIAADLVSGERASGTIKLLLTRPVPRWRILLSKLLALVLYVTMIVFSTTLLAYLISSLIFGFGGWLEPVFIGFKFTGNALNTDSVRLIPQWQYIFMQSGLIWISVVVVGLMSLMLSVLLRSTAAVMGVMLAALIAGLILLGLAASWEEAKYFFMINLNLTVYLDGTPPPAVGMTLGFSLIMLLIAGLISLITAFTVFNRQDIN